MRKIVGLFVWLLLAPTVQADLLFERAGGAAYYDWQQDITWLTDANYAATSGTDNEGDPDGLMSWANSLLWIDSLNTSAHLGITTWRLPQLIDVNSDGSDGGLCNGYSYQDQGEMGFLYYEILDGIFKNDCQFQQRPSYGMPDTGPFINVDLYEHDAYWYEQELVTAPTRAWVMHFEYGGQHADGKIPAGPVWPVFDGDLLYVAGDPLPAAITVDLHPWTPGKIIDPTADELIPVLLLGTATLDAGQIDISTVRLAPGNTTAAMMPLASPVSTPIIVEINGDGFIDMATNFQNLDTSIVCGDTEVTVYGETFTGAAFTGTEAIVTTECETGGCHP